MCAVHNNIMIIKNKFNDIFVILLYFLLLLFHIDTFIPKKRKFMTKTMFGQSFHYGEGYHKRYRAISIYLFSTLSALK